LLQFALLVPTLRTEALSDKRRYSVAVSDTISHHNLRAFSATASLYEEGAGIWNQASHHDLCSTTAKVNALGDGQNARVLARVLKMEIREFPRVFECSRVLKVAIDVHELV
jgi:hypothetical protein